MSAIPPKPWEINRASTPPCCPPGSSTAAANLGNLHSSAVVGGGPSTPPVPPRPSSQQGLSTSMYRPSYMTSSYGNYGSYGGGYGGYSSGYGGYGSSMYGNSMYGSSMYGATGAGGMYGRPGTMQGPGTFSQQAEENTRQAFQSVESVVRAFTSISAMLESTLGAVYSSFRAVLDVADHLSRVKSTFSDALASITLFRFIRYLYRRALSALGIRSHDDAWDSAALQTDINSPGTVSRPNSSQKKSWPILLFAAVVFGGPYLIWKLLSGSSNSKTSETSSWTNGDGDHVIAKAEHSFKGSRNDELSFNAGDTIILAPREQQPSIRGWLLASTDGKNTGYIPSNHVKVLGIKKGRKSAPPTPPTGGRPTPPQQNVPTTASNKEWQEIHSSSSTSAPPTDQPKKSSGGGGCCSSKAKQTAPGQQQPNAEVTMNKPSPSSSSCCSSKTSS